MNDSTERPASLDCPDCGSVEAHICLTDGDTAQRLRRVILRAHQLNLGVAFLAAEDRNLDPETM